MGAETQFSGRRQRTVGLRRDTQIIKELCAMMQDRLTQIEEEPPMTIQVGMVGSDGILLAGDTKWMLSPQGEGARGSRNGTKMLINTARDIAVACACNMEISWPIGENIMKLEDEQWKRPIIPIEEIAKREMEARHDLRRDNAECLIVTARPKPRLFSLSRGLLQGLEQLTCQQEMTLRVIGDRHNPSIFWAERYYREYKDWPIDRLVSLAAHLVVTASALNTACIDGFEVILCRASGIQRVSEASVVTLTAQAKKWDKEIGGLFSAYKEPIIYDNRE
jgi:hypothetical protein